MKKRLLLVDDDPDILDSLALLLEQQYDITVAEDGMSALALVEQQRFDAVVLDLMMPVLDGTRFLQTLRQRGDLQTPVILISAHRDLDKHMMLHRRLGAFASLRKPFDIQELEKRLEQALSQREPGGWAPSGACPPERS
ncbi:hypothetical protein CYFUS_008577 [Cystobacter fuscus]|uniref:Response regulatory domain-containing protein n=1 Tax=Cystobacter fuscus TaxID=43 RepID=A0A250JHM3_9BACT|nr:response regulator [Cystobacter fuscus]ATB43098.1 hypothetical protein CYFUS_008577 [Cystobacter fuscus]